MVDFINQTGIFNPENQKLNIHIIGVGCTGSFIALNLAKLGFEKIKVTDFDKVEEHNIPNQFYRLEDVGKFKVIALKEIIKDFADVEIETENIKIDEDYEFDFDMNSLIIICVDNMESRKLIYEKLKDIPIKLIDTRMGGEGYQIYTINLLNEEEKVIYEKILIERTKDTICGEKSVIYTILSIASETCNIVKKIDKEEQYPKILKREMKTYHILNDLK